MQEVGIVVRKRCLKLAMGKGANMKKSPLVSGSKSMGGYLIHDWRGVLVSKPYTHSTL